MITEPRNIEMTILILAMKMALILLLIFLVLCLVTTLRTFWVVMSLMTALFLSILHSIGEGKREKHIRLHDLLRNRRLSMAFAILVIVYLLLYFIIPTYIMPLVDHNYRRSIGGLVQQIVENTSNDVDKALKIQKWVYGNLVNVYKEYDIDNYIVFTSKPPFVCIRLIGDKYPLWVLATRCGACMEYSLLYRELAYAANLTVRSVHNPGEDHNWDEVYINGTWIIVDPSLGKFNVSSRYYEIHRGLNVSYVYAKYTNGTAVDITERYTNTSIIKIKAVYDDSSTAQAKVEAYSLNYRAYGLPIIGLSCYTDQSGLCQVRLGGGRYKIVVEKQSNSLTYFGEIIIEIAEGRDYNVVVTLHKRPVTVPSAINTFLAQVLFLAVGLIILYIFYMLFFRNTYIS